MRKVNVFTRYYEGAGKYGMKPNGEAVFLTWGMNYEQFSEGIGNYTTAIIERSDGTVEEVQPSEIQFVKEG